MLPILKTRTKTQGETKKLLASLKKQKITNVFVVSGDPSGDKTDTGLTSLDVIPLASKDFYAGAVAHPQVEDIPKMQRKIKDGAKFFIMQASYNQAEWQRWATKIKKKGLDKRVPIIATIIPLLSFRTLGVVRQAQDISLPAEINTQLKGLDDKRFREAGLLLAKTMIQTYLDSGIFSGIYLYSRSPTLVKEMTHFIRSKA